MTYDEAIAVLKANAGARVAIPEWTKGTYLMGHPTVFFVSSGWMSAFTPEPHHRTRNDWVNVGNIAYDNHQHQEFA